MNPHDWFGKDFTPDAFPDASLPIIQAWDQHWEWTRLWPPEAEFPLLPKQGSFTCKANVLTTTHVAHHKHFIIHPVNYRISAWIKCHDGLQVLHMDENCANTIFCFCFFLFKGIMQFLHAVKWLMWKCNLTLKYEQCGYMIKLRLIWSMSCTLNNVPFFKICITKDVSFSY